MNMFQQGGVECITVVMYANLYHKNGSDHAHMLILL